MKLLLLLTHSFPYDSGEEFLAGELEYAAGFDKIVVCPCSLTERSVRTKKLPDGVGCFPVVRRSLGRKSYAGLAVRPPVLEEIAALVRAGRFSAGRVHELFYFMKNAEEIRRGLWQLPELSQADEVLIYSYWFYDAAAAGAMLAEDLKKRGVRVARISRAHGFDIHEERRKYGYLPMRRFLLKGIARLFPCSENGASVFRKQFPQSGSKIETAYLGTKDCGARYGSRKEIHLVSCSYMVEVKRLHLIALALQKADFPVRWTHIGSGPLREQILALASSFPPEVTAEFPGSMDNAAILEYYASQGISVFANVSSSEGISVSIMEACSFGFPVIATDVGGTGEIVADGFNGFLLPADFSPEQFREKLRSLSALSGEEYERMCRNSRAVWEDKFDAARNYREFYDKIGGIAI